MHEIGTPPEPKKKLAFGPIAIVLGGLLLLVVVLTAERKTALNSRNLQPAQTATRDGATSSSPAPDPNASLDELLPPLDLPTVEAQVVRKLQAELSEANETDKAANLDKLVAALSNAGRLDWAAVYAEELAKLKPTETNFKRAADLYTEAVNTSPEKVNPALLQQLNSHAITQWEGYLKLQPNDEEAQIGLALRQVNGPAPMQGILKLRELASKRPKDYTLHLQLGIFAIQTNQLDKALERLEQAQSIRPTAPEAAYQLGIVHKMKGDKAKARTFAALSLKNSQTVQQRSQAEALLRELGN
jgi:tetratricopeptide (TPR) repeat protein